MTEPTRTSTGIAYLTFDASLNTDASMIVQQKLDLSGNATARTFCVDACNLALGRDISGSLLTDSEITDYDSNNLVYLGSNDVNVQKTFLSSNINSTKSLNQMCNAYDMTLGKNNQIPIVSNLQTAPYSLTTFNVPDNNWYSIASSNDGQYLYAIIYNGKIWKSSNYGTSWNSINQTYRWVAIECSGDGKNVVAIKNNDHTHHFYSLDYGVNWSRKTGGYGANGPLSDLALSKVYTNTKSHYLVATNTMNTQSGYFAGMWKCRGDITVTSAPTWGVDYSFGNHIINKWWLGCAISYDGQYAMSYRRAHGIYISNNYLQSWQRKYTDSSRYAYVAAVSGTGQYMVCPLYQSSILLSTDFGVNWSTKYTPEPSSVKWTGVEISSDGSFIVAVGYNDYIYSSKDFGENWEIITELGKRNWRKIAINASNEVYLTEYDGKLYKIKILDLNI